MTLKDKNNVIQDYCNTIDGCGKCLIIDLCDIVDGDFENHPTVCEEAYSMIALDDAPSVKEELVNHPNHYNREGAMECIDEMILIFGKEAVKQFCLCNAWKYRSRCLMKNGTQDLEKSDWYIKKYKELCNE